MSKILCVGSATKDIFFPTTEGKIMETPEDVLSQKKIAFELGAKYKIDERYETLGGCAANVAAGIARLGVDTDCAASVGNDSIGNWIRDEIQKNKAGTSFLSFEEGKKSDLSAIIVDLLSGERTIFSNKNSSGSLGLTPEKIEEFDWIFIGDIHGKWEDELELVIKLVNDKKKKLAFNPREIHIRENHSEIVQAVGLTDVVFVNRDEAIEIVSGLEKDIPEEKINDEKFLLEKLKSLEPEIVVLTDGKRGAWAMEKSGEAFYVPGLEVSAVDSTGAGDAFASAFLSAHIKDKDLVECLKWGIANSSNVVKYYGATSGLLSENEIAKKIQETQVKKI